MGTADKWEREKREKGKELARMLRDSVNGGQIDVEAFVDSMMRGHRTLQQSVMRQLIVPLIWAWADKYGERGFDLRNEETCRLCDKIRDAVGFEGDMPMLPYV